MVIGVNGVDGFHSETKSFCGLAALAAHWMRVSQPPSALLLSQKVFTPHKDSPIHAKPFKVNDCDFNSDSSNPV